MSERIAYPWWYDPRVMVVGVTGSLSLLAYALPEEIHEIWGTSRHFDLHHLLLTWLAISAFVLGLTLAMSHHRAKSPTIPLIGSAAQCNVLDSWYRGLGIVAVVGYGAWIGFALFRGVGAGLLGAVLSRDLGAISDLKSYLRPIAGLTTMTQVSALVSAIGALRFSRDGRVGRLWVFVLVAGLARAIFYAERLALMEVVVPALVILAVFWSPLVRMKWLVRLFPLIGVALLFPLFGVFEYFRSWIYYSLSTDMPFWRWVSLRMLGYYGTSFDNNALFFDSIQGAQSLPYFSVPFIFDFPGVSRLFGEVHIQGLPTGEWWRSVLESSGNPEFNNVGSLLVPLGELGVIAGVGFWFVLGLLVGAVARKGLSSSVIGLVCYSAIFVGLLELPRFDYWTLGRFFPTAVAIMFLSGKDRSICS